jgi:DNA repair photolyase
MKIECVERKSAILSKSSLACLSGVASINLTSGCAHQCVYCYTQGYATHPGSGVVRLYANSLEKLRAELRHKRRPPEVVYFSPACDLFQPNRQVLALAWEVLNILLQEQIRIAFLTKGVIPDRHYQLLCDHAPLVRAQVGLIALNKNLCQLFEPHAALPDVRLTQAKALRACGIEVTGRVDPILPGLTDSPNALEEICSAFQESDVTALAAGILFLRPAITHSLKKNVRNKKILQTLLGAFAHGSQLPIHAANSTVVALPADARREIFGRLSTIAARHGITVHPCACKNPDIVDGCCHIAGHWPQSDPQIKLFP